MQERLCRLTDAGRLTSTSQDAPETDASYSDEIRTERDMLLVTLPSLVYRADNVSGFCSSVSFLTNTYGYSQPDYPGASRVDPSGSGCSIGCQSVCPPLSRD